MRDSTQSYVYLDVTEHWLAKLRVLANKHNQLAINADISDLSLRELWGLYLHLSRLAES
jgi:hypothetical protein